MPASERDVGVERSLHARAGCGLPRNQQSRRALVSPRARGMRVGLAYHSGYLAGLSTRARDAGLALA